MSDAVSALHNSEDIFVEEALRVDSGGSEFFRVKTAKADVSDKGLKRVDLFIPTITRPGHPLDCTNDLFGLQ